MSKSKRKEAEAPGRKAIARNKQAFRNYFISDRFEAGMVLLGSEVKSLRDGRATMSDAYAEIRNGEVWLINLNISPYPYATHVNHEPRRERKLLLHGEEIRKLAIKTLERGFTLVPLQLYFRAGRAKVELGLGKGKQLHDKRDAVRERDLSREMERDAARRDR
jgi:SsrA-binding protein